MPSSIKIYINEWFNRHTNLVSLEELTKSPQRSFSACRWYGYLKIYIIIYLRFGSLLSRWWKGLHSSSWNRPSACPRLSLSILLLRFSAISAPCRCIRFCFCLPSLPESWTSCRCQHSILERKKITLPRFSLWNWLVPIPCRYFRIFCVSGWKGACSRLRAFWGWSGSAPSWRSRRSIWRWILFCDRLLWSWLLPLSTVSFRRVSRIDLSCVLPGVGSARFLLRSSLITYFLLALLWIQRQPTYAADWKRSHLPLL